MLDHRSISDLNVIARTDKQGRSYVRAYKNVWVPKTDTKPGHSKMTEQHHLGALKPNGRVLISQKFLERYPEFAGVDWYYYKNRLYDFEAYQQLVPEATEDVIEQPVSEDEEAPAPTSKHLGASYALYALLNDSGMAHSLKEVFGHDDAQLLMGQAIYNVLGHYSVDSFPDWAYMHYLPTSAVCSGQRLSELFHRITPELMDQFWVNRYRALREKAYQSNVPRYCLIDSTSISTQSTTIEQAEFGHAKQNPEYKQVNLTIVMDQLNGEIIYACESHGSINDANMVKFVCERMKRIGFELSDFSFIADRGYGGIPNLSMLIREKIPFVIGAIITRDSVLEQNLFKHQKTLKGYRSFDYRMGVSAVTTEEKFEDDHTVYTHYYCDQQKAALECQQWRGKLQRVLDLKNDDKPVPANEWIQVKGLLKAYKVGDKTASEQHKQMQTRWKIDEDRWDQLEARAGCFAIQTDVYRDPIETLRIYRLRNLIEVGFDSFKNACDGDRLRCSSYGYYGKLLCYLLAESLMMMIYDAAKKELEAKGDKAVKVPGNSVKAMLLKLDKIQMRRVSINHKWVVDAVTKTQLLWLKTFFKIKALPKSIW